jgi:hypothetical protein
LRAGSSGGGGGVGGGDTTRGGLAPITIATREEEQGNVTATAATNTRLARDRSVNTTTSPGHHEQQLRGAKGGATALDSTGSRGPGNRRYSRRRASDDDDEASGIDVHHASNFSDVHPRQVISDSGSGSAAPGNVSWFTPTPPPSSSASVDIFSRAGKSSPAEEGATEAPKTTTHEEYQQHAVRSIVAVVNEVGRIDAVSAASSYEEHTFDDGSGNSTLEYWAVLQEERERKREEIERGHALAGAAGMSPSDRPRGGSGKAPVSTCF